MTSQRTESLPAFGGLTGCIDTLTHSTLDKTHVREMLDFLVDWTAIIVLGSSLPSDLHGLETIRPAKLLASMASFPPHKFRWFEVWLAMLIHSVVYRLSCGMGTCRV